MTQKDVLKLLRQFVERYPTQREAATALRIKPAYLNDLLHGRRDPGPTVLKALRIRKTYEAIQ